MEKVRHSIGTHHSSPQAIMHNKIKLLLEPEGSSPEIQHKWLITHGLLASSASVSSSIDASHFVLAVSIRK